MNPILQALNRTGNIMQTIAQIKAGNSEGLFNQMMQSNPNFAQFVQQNKGKTAEQIAKENGIDLEQVKRFLS